MTILCLFAGWSGSTARIWLIDLDVNRVFMLRVTDLWSMANCSTRHRLLGHSIISDFLWEMHKLNPCIFANNGIVLIVWDLQSTTICSANHRLLQQCVYCLFEGGLGHPSYIVKAFNCFVGVTKHTLRNVCGCIIVYIGGMTIWFECW